MSDLHRADDAPKHVNRLIHEISPYLLQHANNPVDWYPWGDEALAKARDEDKPILLSVGYSACHWCHVMERESFENSEIAEMMNSFFVNIKVDREERPDIDAIYMDAVQQMTGSGGWPMTVFLTPQGLPFLGGTYFPPVDRYGAPAFPKVLRAVANLYATRREDVERQADEFRQYYQRQDKLSLKLPRDMLLSAQSSASDVLFAAMERLLAQMDPVQGGIGRAPKFPHPMHLEFLLRMESRLRAKAQEEASTQLLALVRLTLDKMAGGGIYDQIGGGFHRYSTDARWLVPHFEKMLYDNALLASAYLHAWQVTGDERYRRICTETLDYVLREMTNEHGGFYSTQDADSDGEEGKFYVWTSEELGAALGREDIEVAEQCWGISDRGNFEGKNILHVANNEHDIAIALNMTEQALREQLAHIREILYNVRAQRVWPGHDDKVLTAWNGLMLRTMAEAGRILDHPEYLRAAVANATFITEQMVTNDGRLLRSWRAGQARIDAYLEDYASLVNGLLSTYEATGEERFFGEARMLADDMLARFWDEAAGSFFDSAKKHEALVGRPRELVDGATPSGMSLAAESLLRLAAFTGEPHYREYAARVLVPLAARMAEQPLGYGHFLCALDDLVGPFYEVALVGDDIEELQRVLSGRYLPRAVLASGSGESKLVPLLDGRPAVNGIGTAYVCKDFVCRLPVTSPTDFEALLAQSELS
ncbi:MAG: uncharacterized protein OJF49_000023 [Ktedonobacterales bacterium]|jgi:uncharacterized protein YyaL (SSP411 family)|nr:MAG: uncharacterized protein OJF49_000023 [Ktedonobacterales bacterium]